MADTEPGTDLAHPTAPDITRGVVTGASLDSRIRYAQVLADAGLVPTAYQRQPANVLYAVETGTMLGIHPIAAINGINVISGKPTISPALMTALVRRAGHKVRVKVTGTVSNEDIRATCEVIRVDDPDFTYSATWDIDRARRAGLWGNRGPWSNYPEAMLKARAIGEVCREAAEDALCGVHYTPEELGAQVNVEGEVVTGEVLPSTPQAPAPVVEALDGDLVRSAILGARSRAELTANMLELGVAVARPDGTSGWPGRAALAATRVTDRDGASVTAWELLGRTGPTLPETTPAHVDPGPVAESVEDLLTGSTDVEDAVVVVERDPTDTGRPAPVPSGHDALSAARAQVRARRQAVEA